MKLAVVALGAALASAAVVQGAAAADIARLEWGSFVVEDDSSNGWKETRSQSSDDGHSVTLTFEAMEAKADGGTMEATSRISGHYDIIQPGVDNFTAFKVTLEGHVIKGNAGVARLVVSVASIRQTIEWPAGTAASEKFKRTVDFVIAGNGRLPSPLVVGLDAFARKEGATEAAYVSVNSMTITVMNPQIAAR